MASKKKPRTDASSVGKSKSSKNSPTNEQNPKPKKNPEATALSKVKGVGAKRAQFLRGAGISNAADLAALKPEYLAGLIRVTQAQADEIIAAAKGLDAPVKPGGTKSTPSRSRAEAATPKPSSPGMNSKSDAMEIESHGTPPSTFSETRDEPGTSWKESVGSATMGGESFGDEILETERGISSPSLADWVKSDEVSKDEAGSEEDRGSELSGEVDSGDEAESVGAEVPGPGEPKDAGKGSKTVQDATAEAGKSETNVGPAPSEGSEDQEIAWLMNLVIAALGLILLLLAFKR